MYIKRRLAILYLKKPLSLSIYPADYCKKFIYCCKNLFIFLKRFEPALRLGITNYESTLYYYYWIVMVQD